MSKKGQTGKDSTSLSSSSESSEDSSSESSSSSSSSSSSDSDVEKKPRKTKKTETIVPTPMEGLSSLWILPFVLMLLAIFYFVVVLYANHLPTALTLSNEASNQGRFIAERAENILALYEAIGPKVVGSFANENITITLLLSEIAKITAVINTTLFSLDVEVQEASGEFIFMEMVNKYQSIHNVVVRLSPLTSNSSAYLLINTHFDSKSGSPGSGDSGAMVVVMLEVLRVIASGSTKLSHPIIFLFNGAEENPVQGSHGFITTHRWAKNCKALINLDSAGSGGREIVFESGPNNPWIMKYYKMYAVYPYASILAEELNQREIIPSLTDFRIFKKYGPIVGLDMAHVYNGYVYHTKYDKMDVIPRETLQNTGDNVLALAKGFANAPELENPSLYAAGSTVFYDILSKYLVLYSSSVGMQINYGVAAVAILVKLISTVLISLRTKVSLIGVTVRSMLTLVVHVLGIGLGAGLSIVLAIHLDGFGVPLSWFTYKWMVIGLYFCPFIFGFGFPTALLIGFMKNDKLNLACRVQLILNAQLFVVSLLTIDATFHGFKSAYIFMLATLSFTIALIFNMITTLNCRGYYWVFAVVLLQIPAFIYFTYIGSILLNIVIPSMGRFDISKNPDLYVAGICVVIAFLSLGFLLPLINIFKKSKSALLGTLVIAGLFVGIAFSPLGFPFRPATNVERFNFIHTRRIFHEANNTVSKNESGYYFDLQDRRKFSAVTSVVDTSQVISMTDQCSQHMFCGLPVFNHRWNRNKVYAKFLPSNDVELPGVPTLTLLSQINSTANSTIQFNFRVDGPPHMGIFIGPLAGSSVVDWTFIKDMLIDNWAPPYFIYFTKAKGPSALDFFVKFQKTFASFSLPTFEIGIGGHYVSTEYARGNETTAFTAMFPPFTFPMEWPGSYERWVY